MEHSQHNHPAAHQEMAQKNSTGDKTMDHSGHNPAMGHEGHDHMAMIADFKKRFYIILALTVPVVLLSPMIQQFICVNWQFPDSMYLLFALSTVVFFYGGWPFLTGWLSEIKARNLGMMTLIGFAITVAYVYSVATVFGLKDMDLFGTGNADPHYAFRALDRNEIGGRCFQRTGAIGTADAFGCAFSTGGNGIGCKNRYAKSG